MTAWDLVLEYQGAIRHTAWMLSHSLSMDMDDLVSVAMIGAYKAATRYEPERGPAGSWLRYGANHEILDESRREGRCSGWYRNHGKVAYLTPWPVGPVSGEPQDFPDESPPWEEGVELLAEIDRAPLGDREKTVVRLLAFSDLTKAEIAEHLNVTPSRISQILTEVRRKWKP